MASSDLKPLHTVFDLENSSAYLDPGFLCGVEYEVENVIKLDDDFYEHNYGKTFDTHEDPSLRNEGREYVTRPASYEAQLKLFDDLHHALEFYEGDIDPYSDRTSTHVHVNFRPVTINKITQFVRLYTLFEPYFFSLVDPTRQDNIYCVPLNYTYLPKTYYNNITYQIQRWHKYTAFNIVPLASKGTIEFRHLQGTGDKQVFEKWLSTIKKLYDFNQTYNVEFNRVLRSDEDIQKLHRDIFNDGDFPIDLLDATIVDVKIALARYTESTLRAKVNKLTEKECN
jgi:hypothetical protein